MTIKQVIRTVREMGMTCNWKSEVSEFRINFPAGTEATAYYTSDRNDAIQTAMAMLRERFNQ